MNRAVMVLLVLAQAAVLKAQNPERATLRGLRQVQVLVTGSPGDAMPAGLSEEQLKTDVELRLRKAHLPVADSAGAYLFVKVNAIQLSSKPGLVYSLHVGLDQAVTLSRDKSISCLAPTWSRNFVGIISSKEFISGVRSQVGDFVDEFINDYLAANQ